MYAGDNPIAKRSQRMLLAALEGLQEEKPFAEITVREICERSGVSRQTFYKLFGSKEALVLYQLQTAPFAGDPPEGRHDGSLAQSCAAYAAFVSANWDTLRMLVENGLTEVLFDQMSTSFESCRTSFAGATMEERAYASQFAAGGLTRITCAYLADHDAPDARELARLAFRIMSGAVYARMS